MTVCDVRIYYDIINIIDIGTYTRVRDLIIKHKNKKMKNVLQLSNIQVLVACVSRSIVPTTTTTTITRRLHKKIKRIIIIKKNPHNIIIHIL